MKTLGSKETKASKEIRVTHNSVFAAHRLQCRMTIHKVDIRHFLFYRDNQRRNKAKGIGMTPRLRNGKFVALNVLGLYPHQPTNTVTTRFFQRTFHAWLNCSPPAGVLA